MIGPNTWVNDLNMLQQNGVVGYTDVMPMLSSHGQGLTQKPDQFVKSAGQTSGIPTWKKVLTGLLVTGLAALAGYKLFKLPGSIVKLFAKKP